MNIDNTMIVYAIIIVALVFIIYKGASLILKIGFILIVSAYLYYQYGHGLL